MRSQKTELIFVCNVALGFRKNQRTLVSFGLCVSHLFKLLE